MVDSPMPPGSTDAERPEPDRRGDLVQWGIARLRAAGVPTPESDVAAILSAVSPAAVSPGSVSAAAVPRDSVSRGSVPELCDEEPDGRWYRTRFELLIRRRAERVPLEYLLGWASLGPVTVRVGPGVFVPQRDSAAMIDWCSTAMSGIARPVAVDLCTGSGAIALALALSRPEMTVYAVDSSERAVQWAALNVELAAKSRDISVEVRRGDATDAAVLSDIAGTADLVVANPPYLPDGSAVPPELGRHVEASALFGGPDGLEVIRGVIAVAMATLRAGGRLALEHAAGQAAATRSLIDDAGGFRSARSHPDHDGTLRFVTARRNGGA